MSEEPRYSVSVSVQLLTWRSRLFIGVMIALVAVGGRLFGRDRWLRWAHDGAMRLARYRIGNRGPWRPLPSYMNRGQVEHTES